jgi:predicted transcriptional regulator
MPMKIGFERVTDTELALLNHLWDSGGATIRELTDAMYPDGTDAQYATVQKLLERLEAKRFVTRDRSERAHLFTATVSRREFIGSRLQGMANDLCGGSLTALLTNLIETPSLSAKERASLRELVNRLAGEQKGDL